MLLFQFSTDDDQEEFKFLEYQLEAFFKLCYVSNTISVLLPVFYNVFLMLQEYQCCSLIVCVYDILY